jgi:hypothetical protein
LNINAVAGDGDADLMGARAGAAAHLGTPLPAIVHVADEMALEPIFPMSAGDGVGLDLRDLLACLAELVPRVEQLVAEGRDLCRLWRGRMT